MLTLTLTLTLTLDFGMPTAPSAVSSSVRSSPLKSSSSSCVSSLDRAMSLVLVPLEPTDRPPNPTRWCQVWLWPRPRPWPWPWLRRPVDESARAVVDFTGGCKAGERANASVATEGPLAPDLNPPKKVDTTSKHLATCMTAA